MTDSDSRSATSGELEVAASFRKILILLMLMGIPLIGVLVYLNVQKANSSEKNVDIASP